MVKAELSIEMARRLKIEIGNWELGVRNDNKPIISNPLASELLVTEIRRRQCRVPTGLFLVGRRHCRLLYIIGRCNRN